MQHGSCTAAARQQHSPFLSPNLTRQPATYASLTTAASCHDPCPTLRAFPQTERKKNADEARSAGWLKAPASPAKPITTAPADSSALEGLTSDQKLALVLQEMVGLQRALADHTRVSNDLKRFLMEGSGMSA
jgi:hypothetical protein